MTLTAVVLLLSRALESSGDLLDVEVGAVALVEVLVIVVIPLPLSKGLSGAVEVLPEEYNKP